MKKNYNKIKKMLGREYHLHLSYEENKVEWRLFKKLKNEDFYLSDFNIPLMTNETHSYRQLYRFAKNHSVMDEKSFLVKSCNISLILYWIIFLLNIFIFDSDVLDYIIIGYISEFFILCLLYKIMQIIQLNHNIRNIKIELYLSDKVSRGLRDNEYKG